ncbi:hypothetical protein PV04_07178 [Phialophora macrospora]|uniref:NACHT domain-containing protein n=1 Tax=Phialophora macrospora TaxID=1851006 RepID=A0A0D2FY95_9EURO|nr:hypothetical protein PV04_07178 [Phialophora macrospora]
MSQNRLRPADVHVGWICAVQTEYVVACELLDEEYPPLASTSQHDNNTYTFGRMNKHNVVIACLPKGKYGISSAASVAKDMRRSFPSIRFGLMVGIGGGAPSEKNDIRLGDVVVSLPTIQNQKLERTGALNAPPLVLLTALNAIGARHERKGHHIAETVKAMVDQNRRLEKKYGRPETGTDQLFESTFIHPDREQPCAETCSTVTARTITRRERLASEDDPVIHYGLIASADRLMKDAQARDTLSREEGVLCFDMEAAGLMHDFPCVVIRGICDYSDTHKNDMWQGYAAAVAAAYAKELLEVIQPTEVVSLSPSTSLSGHTGLDSNTVRPGCSHYVRENVNHDTLSVTHTPVTSYLPEAFVEDGLNCSRGFSHVDKDSALIELWPATPQGEISKISTTTDIIAIHGVGGHPFQTWTEGSRLWLRDLLPSEIPKARVSTFGYNSVAAFDGDASGVYIWAVQLLEALRELRSLDKDPNRKMFFICHSLGGLLFKQAFLIAQEKYQRYSSISLSIAGVIFMGTPHHGRETSDWSKIFSRLDRINTGFSSSSLSTDLKLKSENLGTICSRFSESWQQLQIFTVVETVKIDTIKDLVVSEESAILHSNNETCRRLQADHTHLCKFASASLRSCQSSFLKSLIEVHPETMIERVSAPHEDSCQWITRTLAFLDWKNNPKSRLLWIHGAPGSGKTIMTKHIISHLKSAADADTQQQGASHPRTDQFVVYFFCDDKNPFQRTSHSLVRSILYQIIHRDGNFHLLRYVEEVVTYPKVVTEKPVVPDPKTLWKCLSQIMQKSRGARFWIIVDALDELERNSRKDAFLEIEAVMRSDPVGHVKFLLTSRELLERRTPSSASFKRNQIDMDNADVRKDVRHFINMEMEKLFDDTALSKQLWEEVEKELIRVSSGTFLHASLALANFSAEVESWTSSVVRERLSRLKTQSPELESFYCNLLRRIPTHFRGQARQILAWTLYCYEPLTLEDLHCAVSMNEQHQSFAQVQEDMTHNFAKKEIAEYCGYLVTVDGNGFVRFSHQSVKDFLLGHTCLPANEEIVRFFRVSPDEIHVSLTRKCLRMLQLNDFSNPSVRFSLRAAKRMSMLSSLDWVEMKAHLRQYPALAYATMFWSRHAAQVAENIEVVGMVSGFMLTTNAEFFRSLTAPWMRPAYQKFPWKEPEDEESSEPPLHHLLQQGDFPEMVQRLVNLGQDLNQLDGLGMSPLHWAIARGRTRSFKTLMHSTDIDPNRANPGEDKAIHQSIYWLRPDMLVDLLNHSRVDVNIRGRRNQTAFHTAVEYPASGAADILLRLKSESLDFLALDSDNQTPLEIAFRRGNSDRSIVARIVRAVDMKNTVRFSAGAVANHLMVAGVYGWTEVEETILKNNPSVVLHLDDEGMNSLTRYAYYGRKSKVAMLLSQLPASAIDSSTLWGRYNLAHLCAQQDWEDIFNLLREKFGLSEFGRDHLFRSVLHWAVEFGWDCVGGGHFGAEKHLIDKQDRDGLTALHLSVLNRNEKALRVLLNQGADYLLRDKYGKTPVHMAAESGYRAAVQLFLDSPTREYGRDRQGASLLHYMVM